MASSSSQAHPIEYDEMAPGPVEPSVLYLQPQHCTNNIDMMERVEPDGFIDHSSTSKLVTSAHPGVLELLDRAGFGVVNKLGYTQLDRNLLTALIDRWRPKTSTFHLRVGEMTITLKDVAVLLGLPINGDPILNPDYPRNYMDLCEPLLELAPPEDVRWGAIWMLSSKDFALYHKFSIELLALPLRVRFCQLIAVRNGKLLLHMNDGTQRLEYYDLETDCFENATMIARDLAYYEKENCRLGIFNEDSSFIVISFVESLVPLAGYAAKN